MLDYIKLKIMKLLYGLSILRVDLVDKDTLRNIPLPEIMDERTFTIRTYSDLFNVTVKQFFENKDPRRLYILEVESLIEENPYYHKAAIILKLRMFRIDSRLMAEWLLETYLTKIHESKESERKQTGEP